MTAYPPAPFPIDPTNLPKRRGVMIGVILMLLGAIGGGIFAFASGKDFVDTMSGGTYYEIALDSSFPAPGTEMQGIFATAENVGGLTLTSDDAVVARSESDSLATAVKVRIREGALEVELHQQFTFTPKDGAEYELSSTFTSPGVRYFVGKGVDGSQLGAVAAAVLIGGLIFLVGLIVLIVSLVRRSRDRKQAAWTMMQGQPQRQGQPQWQTPPGPDGYPQMGGTPPPPPGFDQGGPQGFPPPPPPPPGFDQGFPPPPPPPPSDNPESDGWASPQ